MRGGGGDLRPRAGERRGGIDLRAILHGGLRSFRELRSGPCMRENVDCGFDLWFWEGRFCKTVTDASCGPSDRRSTARIELLYYCSKLQ